MLFVGVELNSSGDPDINCSCWHVRLVVGLSWGGGGGGGLVLYRGSQGWGGGQGLKWVWG